MKNRFWKIIKKLMPKAPFWLKMFIAKLLLYALKDLDNDMVLYNELLLWIETKGRPQSSNPNVWINKH